MNKPSLLLALALLLPSAAVTEENGPAQPEQAEQAAAEQAGQPEQAADTTATEPYHALLQRSPFLTRAYLEQQRRARNRGGAQLAFHGYFRADDNTWVFSVLNAREQTSQWVVIGDTIGNTTISAFDPQGQKLTVTSEGTSIELPLSRPEN